MRFLHVKVVKSDAQWTEVKALKCWSAEIEMKSSHVRHFKSFWLCSEDASFL